MAGKNTTTHENRNNNLPLQAIIPSTTATQSNIEKTLRSSKIITKEAETQTMLDSSTNTEKEISRTNFDGNINVESLAACILFIVS